MAQPKKARGGFPYLWAVAGFCLVGVLAFVIRWSPGTEAYDLKVREDRLARLDEIQKAAEEKLSGYRWVDQEKQVVALPIERAMELAVTDLKNENVGPSDVKAVSTGSLIVPPYLKAAAPAQEEAAGEAETAPAEGAEGTDHTAPASEAAPAAETESAEEAPAPDVQEEAPATPEPAAESSPEAAASPAAEPTAPAPSEDEAAAEPTPSQAPSPSETTGEAAPDATAETPIGD